MNAYLTVPARYRPTRVDSLPNADVDGALSIEDGLVCYHPPRGNGGHPVIEPGENVRVHHNDRLVERPAVVSPNDRLRLEVEDRPPQTQIGVDVRPDELTASLVIRRTPGIRYAIPDHPPARYLKPRAEASAAIDAPDVTVDEAMAALFRAGVRYGLDPGSVQQAVELANAGTGYEGRPFVVALGDVPRPPRDGEVRLAPGLEPGAPVEPGQVLARKTPAIPGRAGRSVRDRPIPVPDPKDPALRAAGAAALSPDGLTVTATGGGRLVVRGATVAVQPVQHIDGDLAGAGATVRFPGDVVVTGQVRAGAVIESGGAVRVAGAVDAARIRSAEGIEVGGGVFRSTLQAGSAGAGEQAALLASLLCIEQELADLDELTRAIARATGRSEGELAPAVLERKGASLRQLLEQLRALPVLDEDTARLAGLLTARLTGPAAASIDGMTLRSLAEQAQAARKLLDTQPAERAPVRVAYAHHSVIHASGRIHLTGRGSYQSQLHAGEGLEAPAGRLIGGHIVVGGGNVVCQILGGPSAVTQVSVAHEGSVCAQVVVPDIVLQIGGQRIQVTRSYRQVCFAIRDGRIVARAWVR